MLGCTLGVFNMLHNPKRVKRSEKHAKKTEKKMASVFKKEKNFSKWMRKVPKHKKDFRYEPPE